ncbi:ATP-binding protein [Corynebacterium sp. ES2715-CONJ3]|uniref:ATP-binding protein n=1 Tax=Corynebacterium sp. ES2715-CONJ3 TaxID=2974028 RepID=UPI002167B132|nr:AAA family ATPase [Corynebacterium sp. ES2715-CONJ3]MCS4490923.1 AAA family ATPase [Corynebacterium sp. ES2715-CONJ3]
MSAQIPPLYPFSAVVGHEKLQVALLLNAISPQIGGVVIRGEKGTAKTTTVRAFAGLLEGAPLINLPIGATEDRVVGALDLETILHSGRAEYRPGLLAAANGGVLYVDEVNLLADHIVDALLDAAATGIVTVERDGISHSAAAKFVLVGTMNPEEGELRPQLLDRFGLSVAVEASRDVAVRTEIMRRRLEFDRNPRMFCEKWRAQELELERTIAEAKQLVGSIELSDTNLERIGFICASFDVDGMRADLVIARTAIAHAALKGRVEVTDEDIRVAAELALAHRKRRNPFDEPGLDESQLDEVMDQAQQSHPDEDPFESSEQHNRDQPPASQDDDSNTPDMSETEEVSADQGATFRGPTATP